MAFRRLFPFDVVADGAVTGSPVAPQINLGPTTQNIFFGIDDNENLWVNDNLISFLPNILFDPTLEEWAFEVSAAPHIISAVVGVGGSLANGSHSYKVAGSGGIGGPTGDTLTTASNSLSATTSTGHSKITLTFNYPSGDETMQSFLIYRDDGAGYGLLTSVENSYTGNVIFLDDGSGSPDTGIPPPTGTSYAALVDWSPSGIHLSTLDVNGQAHIDKLLIDERIILETPSVPANAAATGTKGEIAWDSGFIYVCINTNTWKRVAIASW